MPGGEQCASAYIPDENIFESGDEGCLGVGIEDRVGGGGADEAKGGCRLVAEI